LPSARYRYLICDLLTDQPIATLPLTGVKFSRRISRVGEFSGNWDIAVQEQASLLAEILPNLGRCSLWVYRQPPVPHHAPWSLWWGGIIWQATPTRNARGPVSISFKASTFDSYAHRRLILQNLVYKGQGQEFIMHDLWARMQARSEGDIGVQTSAAGKELLGTRRDRTYLFNESASYGKRIEELGDVIGGLEHTIDIQLNGDNGRLKILRTQSSLGFDRQPFVMTGIKIPTVQQQHDTGLLGTAFVTRGDPDAAGNVVISNVYENTALLAAGWPLLDIVEDYPGVVLKTTLNTYASGLRAAYSKPSAVPKYVVLPDEDTDWNPNFLGTPIVMKFASNEIWAPAKNSVVRPTVVEVQPGERGQAETLSFTTDGEET